MKERSSVMSCPRDILAFFESIWLHRDFDKESLGKMFHYYFCHHFSKTEFILLISATSQNILKEFPETQIFHMNQYGIFGNVLSL